VHYYCVAVHDSAIVLEGLAPNPWHEESE